MLRANTGLTLRANGAALTALLQQLTRAWPVPVERIALVGHSMGGLVFRAAAADVVDDCDDRWVDRVSDVVTLGTPHLGSPVAGGVGAGSRALGLVPESAALGRILDWRSVGVHDLVHGLAARRAPAAARALPAGGRHPHPIAPPPGRGRARRLPGPGPVGVRARALAASCSRARTCCTSAVPGTSTCSTTRACTRRCSTGSPEGRPSRRRPPCAGPRIRCGRTGVVIAWKCPCFGLVSLT